MLWPTSIVVECSCDPNAPSGPSRHKQFFLRSSKSIRSESKFAKCVSPERLVPTRALFQRMERTKETGNLQERDALRTVDNDGVIINGGFYRKVGLGLKVIPSL